MVSEDYYDLFSIPCHRLGYQFREIYEQRTNSNELVRACLTHSKAEAQTALFKDPVRTAL